MLTPQDFGDAELGAWLRLVAEQTRGNAFILLNVAGEVLWWSPAAEAIFSRSRKDALGLSITEIFTPEDRRLDIASLELKIADRDATSEDDRWHLRADGSRFWSAGTMSAVRDHDGKLLGFCKILRDRTSLKEQLEHLSAKVDAAKRADAARTAAITTLTHELRNLLAAVFHGARMLRTADDPKKREHLIEMLEEQAEGVRRLTDDMFEASRVSLGRVSIACKDICLTDVVAQVVEAAQSQAQSKNIGLVLLAPSAPIRVSADSSRLYQVFSNLVDNAIKYTDHGGRIWVKLTVEDSEAIVHVEDNGIGIAADMLTSIFDLFTQANTFDRDRSDVTSVRNATQGLGVGLAVVKEIIALHGGSVQAASGGIGRGSQFTIRLPLLTEDVM